jgi:hypothetical protein
MTEREIKMQIIDNAETMAKSIHKGKDVEIKYRPTGIIVHEVDKKKLA